MPVFEVTAPDGTKWEVNAPDGATEQQALAYAQKQWSTRSQQQGSTNRSIADQVGLAARAMTKGALSLPGIVADAAGGIYNTAADLVAPGKGWRKIPTARALDGVMDSIGLPRPDTPEQRIVAQAVEMGTGAGVGARAAQAGANVLSGAAKDALGRLGVNPLAQVAAGAGGGAAGQHAREVGAGPLGEVVSSVVGGLAAGGAVQGAQALRSSFSQPRQLAPAEVEARVMAALQSRGIDPRSITPAMRTAILEDARKAMRLGRLDDGALARLADYRRLGLEPTRGRLTLDPLDVTREQNAMRLAAATGNADARLPQIAQGNNQGLVSAIEGMNPIRDSVATGERVMQPILSRDASMQAAKSQLYKQAEQMAGGSVPLEKGPLNGVWGALERARKLRFLPSEVAGTINDILSDTRAPLTVNVLDELKTTIATAQRGTKDGNVKAALGIVRDYLDGMPIKPDFPTGPGLATAAQAQVMRAADDGTRGLIDALNEARSANAAWRGWQRSAPGIQAAVEGAAPDNFVRQQILSRSASVENVAKLADEINQNPQAREAVRSAIVQHLKDAGIGRGNEAQTASVNGRQWLAALSDIGDRKLALFFAPDEVEQLKAIGRVGAIEVFQPRGSAVNNSNTAAGVAGLLQGLSRYVKPLAGKLPFGQEVVGAPMDNITLSVMQRGAMNIPRGLLAAQPQAPVGLLDPYALPLITGGGLLSQP